MAQRHGSSGGGDSIPAAAPDPVRTVPPPNPHRIPIQETRKDATTTLFHTAAAVPRLPAGICGRSVGGPPSRRGLRTGQRRPRKLEGAKNNHEIHTTNG